MTRMGWKMAIAAVVAVLVGCSDKSGGETGGAGVETAEPADSASPDDTEAALHQALADGDVVLTTGGVSKGDQDYVPDAVRDYCTRLWTMVWR